MKKTKLASTLKYLLQAHKLTESELARKTGICQPVIHRLASGETDNPKIESLRPIAKFFSISLDQLIGDIPLELDPTCFNAEPLFTVPLITMIDALSWPQKNIQSPTLVQTDIKISESAFAVRLQKSTMHPTFPDGTLLIIEPNIAYQHGDFVVAHLKDEQQPTFKQFLVDGQRHYLKSINTDYPGVTLTQDDRILGVMLQARIDIRKD